MTQDGIKIPRFSSAAGQLNHAASGFRNKKEKRAALRAVTTLFPQNLLEGGHAALGLAFLHLEPDYRFAKPIDIRKSVNDFQTVLKEYAPFPDVQAKAHWYLGWIYTVLDGEPKKGLQHFWTIVKDFPEVPVNLSLPVPWVNLVYSDLQTDASPLPIRPKFWSQIALLEIVRHGSRAEAIEAFNILYNRFFPSIETGFALKSMLANPGLASHVLYRVSAYLARQTTNPYLVRDIAALAKENRP